MTSDPISAAGLMVRGVFTFASAWDALIPSSLGPDSCHIPTRCNLVSESLSIWRQNAFWHRGGIALSVSARHGSAHSLTTLHPRQI